MELFSFPVMKNISSLYPAPSINLCTKRNIQLLDLCQGLAPTWGKMSYNINGFLKNNPPLQPVAVQFSHANSSQGAAREEWYLLLCYSKRIQNINVV